MYEDELLKYDMEKVRMSGADFLQLHIPRYEELPAISLYLDQVISILNQTLTPFFEEGEDKIITGAMVNNYVKHKVIEPPRKKRYNRTHVSCLFIICILKKIFSISEIGEMMEMHGQEEDIARDYNHFCDQLEKALRLQFADHTAGDTLSLEEDLTEPDMGRAMAQALANKLFVQKMIQCKRTSGEQNPSLTEKL